MKQFIFPVMAAGIGFGMTMPSCQKPNNSNPPINPSNAVVTTLAGPSFGSSTLGSGSTSSFNYPTGVAVDGMGNVYVAGNHNSLILKISPAGVVTTLAGSGTRGSANGTGTAASFDYPTGVALDLMGNVYVADAFNNLIREISPSGVVSTLAGGGTSNILNGTGTAASFNNPQGVAVDALGNVYVADYGNMMIRKISPSGVVSTLAGSGQPGSANGVGAVATFYNPAGVAVDATGNVYVADAYNNMIRKISPSGVVSTLAGSGQQGDTNGPGTAASFYDPFGVAVDAAGNVYVGDLGNDLIRKISPSGVVSTLAGSGARGSANGVGPVASFNQPSGVAVDAAANVYVADANNNLIRKITQ